MADNVLIDPSTFPVIHPPTASVTGEDTRGWGSDLLSGTEEINTIWTRLVDYFKVPEQEAVLAMLEPAVRKAKDVNDRLGRASDALYTYAGDLVDIKKKFDDLTIRANAFRTKVEGGWMDTAHNVNLMTGESDSFEYHREWWEKNEWSEENGELKSEARGLWADLRNADSTCAAAINKEIDYSVLPEDVVAVPDHVEVSGDDLAELEGAPWGPPYHLQEKTFWQSTKFAIWDEAIVGGISDIGTLLGYNPETGGFFDGSIAGPAWGGDR